MNKWDFIKLKSFCTTKEMVSKLKKLTSPKINEPIKKWATDLNRTFSKKKCKWPKNT
jgi:hypothetical protein